MPKACPNFIRQKWHAQLLNLTYRENRISLCLVIHFQL